jgi:membrane protein
MARLRDVPHVFRTIGFFGFLKRVWQQVSEDNVFTWGSALAYSWLFAVFPFLIFMLSLVPLIPERFKPNIEQQINDAIDRTVPSKDTGQIIKDQAYFVLHTPKESAKGFLSVGLLLTIWGASGGMSMTMSALDKAYDIEKSRGFIRHRLVAGLLTLVVAVMVILVLILLPISTGVIAWFVRFAAEKIPASHWLIWLVNVARYAIALVLMFGITATIYHFGPNLKHRFYVITPGAVFSIGVWLALGILFRIYITNYGGEANYRKTYGTVAGLVILLLFFYIDALVLLIGAEINSEIDFAIAGVPSGGASKEEREIAPIPTPENVALAKELDKKRSDEASAPPPIDVSRS